MWTLNVEVSVEIELILYYAFFFIIIDLRPEIGENVTSPGNRDDEVDIEAAEGCFISTTSLTLLRNIQVWLCFLEILRILRRNWRKF